MSAIYDTIRGYLLSLVKKKQVLPNQRLPSERQLLERFSASRITIREALFRLESEGLIYRLNRKGWFLAPPRFIIDLAKKADFNQMAEMQGRVANTHVLQQKQVPSKSLIRHQLALPKGAKVYEIIRVRSLDSRPILLETIYLCAKRFAGIGQYNLNASLTALQSECFAVDIRSEQCQIKVDTLGEHYNDLLEVNAAMPTLRVERTRFDKSSSPVDFNREHWLHNAVELQVGVS